MSDTTWPLFDSVIEPAARKAAPLVKQYGWDADDCAQEAARWLIEKDPLTIRVLGLPAAERAAYLNLSVRRWIVRRARPKGGLRYQREIGSLVDKLEDRGVEAAGVLLEINDLVRFAPGDVGRWLQLRVLDGLTWREAEKVLGWTRHYTATVRDEAAKWLLAQFEGHSAEDHDG